MRIARINEAWKFPNGVFIFGSDGKQIDPSSDEGQIISDIYAHQKEIRKANREQKEKYILDTFPRDKVKQAEYRKRFGLD